MNHLGHSVADVNTEQIDEALRCKHQVSDLPAVWVLDLGHLKHIFGKLVSRLPVLVFYLKNYRRELLGFGVVLRVIKVEELACGDPNADSFINAQGKHKANLVDHLAKVAGHFADHALLDIADV